ncbi:hypothetical protein [Solicola sp. PLA-1-18]|uniref:hypothetical protein n=1 Tax=Solicola sp. PLA-1-18 TaxID=3380532 RepID=UPI003B80DF42
MSITRTFRDVRPRPQEVAASLVGDEIVPHADVVMDRAFTVAAPPEAVWPWLEQLGKGRAGWYLPRSVERVVPAGRRAARVVDERWLGLTVGDVVPDWGGSEATFEVALVDPPSALVHRSTRGSTSLSWALVLTAHSPASTRVHLRLRLAPVAHVRVAEVVGGFFDLATVAGMAAGLRERVAEAAG